MLSVLMRNGKYCMHHISLVLSPTLLHTVCMYYWFLLCGLYVTILGRIKIRQHRRIKEAGSVRKIY